FLEQGWLAVDPFAVQPHPLLLGSPCSACARPVCTADTCSLFYAKRFCAEPRRASLRAAAAAAAAQLSNRRRSGSNSGSSSSGSSSWQQPWQLQQAQQPQQRSSAWCGGH
ncbi:Cysteine-rich DPF motif domain-containing protein 1, partial [Tetrabaena socialis]